MQIIEQPADRSLDGAGFVPTHAIQKSAGDQGVDVGVAYLKQVTAKPTSTTFTQPLHADRTCAAVWLRSQRTGVCSYGLRNQNYQSLYKEPSI
jgi:hypothetical protein